MSDKLKELRENSWSWYQGGGTGGGDSVQADWNESDPTSPAYIQNRIGGYKQSEAERLVEYDETTAEYIDVDVTGSGTALRYRKASDTLVHKEDWVGGKVVFGFDAGEGESEMSYDIGTGESGALSITEAYFASGTIWLVGVTGLACGIIAPQKTNINASVDGVSVQASGGDDTVIPKGVWVLDLPWYGSEIMGSTETMYHKAVYCSDGVVKIPEEYLDTTTAETAQATAETAQATADEAKATVDNSLQLSDDGKEVRIENANGGVRIHKGGRVTDESQTGSVWMQLWANQTYLANATGKEDKANIRIRLNANKGELKWLEILGRNTVDLTEYGNYTSVGVSGISKVRFSTPEGSAGTDTDLSIDSNKKLLLGGNPVATEYTAGDGITIEDGVISCTVSAGESRTFENLFARSKIVYNGEVAATVESQSDGSLKLTATDSWSAYNKRIELPYTMPSKVYVMVQFEALSGSTLPFNVNLNLSCLDADWQPTSGNTESEQVTINTEGTHVLSAIMSATDDMITDGKHLTIGFVMRTAGAIVQIKDYVVLDVSDLDDAKIAGYNFPQYLVDGYVENVTIGGTGGSSSSSAWAGQADYDLPVMELTGDISTMTKQNPVTLNYTFGENYGTLTCKWQGGSSLAYDKKNYTITFDTALEVQEGWGTHQKYVLKANYMDFSHSRNIVSARLWAQMVAARDTENATLKACPNYGAIDGYPITLTINGEFYGVYTLNIPKDPWMMNMGSGTNECILCAGNYCDTNLFKAEATLVDDTDLEIEYITDEADTAWAVTSVNNLINACINSDGSDLDTTIATMLDWDSAIDYCIFLALLRGDDMVAKNYLLNTYDGTKWFFGAYDMDSTFGLNWDGKSFLEATKRITFEELAFNHRLFELICTYKKDTLKARYKALRAGVMSEDNVGMMFRNFAGQIPAPLLAEDNRKWTHIPNTNCNNVQQILDWYRLRVATIDAEVDAM